MLTIDIRVNGRLIAFASARNLSDLSPVSDYEVKAFEHNGPFTDERRVVATIEGHNREQSSWALVEKIAQLMTRADESGEVKHA